MKARGAILGSVLLILGITGTSAVAAQDNAATPVVDGSEVVATVEVTPDASAATETVAPENTDAIQASAVPGIPGAPAAGDCQQLNTGRTIWLRDASDITTRDKTGDGGEVNADGWANTLRLYGATTNAQTNVTAVFTATQGFSFVGGYNSLSTPGAGQLQNNGFTMAADGIVIDVTPTTVTVIIASMPANSSWSFNVDIQRTDDANDLYMDSYMLGDLVECEIPTPTEVPTETPVATETPEVTETPVVTETAAPTETAEVTAASAPETPVPTATTPAAAGTTPAPTATTPATSLPNTGTGTGSDTGAGFVLAALAATALAGAGVATRRRRS